MIGELLPDKLPDMTKTLEVVADRSAAVDELVAAGELLDMRFQSGRSALSLRAAKLLHTLVHAAGADAGLPKQHRISLNRLNYVHHLSKEELLDTVRELFGVAVQLKVLNAKGKRAIKVGPLLSDIERDEEQDGELRYELSPVLRAVMKNSNHWAVLSRKAVLAFQSRYSLRLYELISLRIGLEKVASEQFSIEDLRSLFGVPAGKLPRWQDLKSYVIEPAIAEVSQLTGLAVRYQQVKVGRGVVGVVLIWREKDPQARNQAARELDRSSLGRAARRAGTVEAIAPIAAPSADLVGALRSLESALAKNLRAP